MFAGSDALSVGELSKCLRAAIEAEDLFRDILVRGEISNLTRHSSGHVYFSLKDETALIRGVMWSSAARTMRIPIENGMRILARGRVGVYEKQGYYQLIVNELQPDGIGALYAAFEKLKARLRDEGLFDEVHKKPIPRFPRRIAIITSKTAAALRDMVTVARRRMPSVDLLVSPTLMQGEDAHKSVCESLRVADGIPGIDVVVVGRGGGSLEDLWTFNTEPVVRSIHSCRTPVVSAIGHETDFTLSDLAADLRAPTPSAAMEQIVPDRGELLARVRGYAESMASSMQTRLERHSSRLAMLADSPSLRRPERILEARRQSLDQQEERLVAAFENTVSTRRQRLAESSAALQTLSPLGVLTRGYGIVLGDGGSIIRSHRDVSPGQSVHVILADGRLHAEVTGAEEEVR